LACWGSTGLVMDPLPVRRVGIYYPGREGLNVQKVGTVPFTPNTLLAFMTATSVHGAELPANTDPRFERFTYQLLVTPDDETWRRAATAIDIDAAELLHASSVEAVLAASFPSEDIRVMKGRPLRFHCDCSSERVSNALRMLGRAEIESILAEQGTIGVKCEFCGRSYTFGAADALALFPQTGATDAPASADTKRGE